MNVLPFDTKGSKAAGKSRGNSVQLAGGEAKVASQGWWPSGAIENKHGFGPWPKDMHVRWSMIVWIKHDPQAIDSQGRRHIHL
jgi:hypothetical protein